MNITERRGGLPDCDEFARRLDHGCNARRIVERAIVDRVLARLGVCLDAEMVEMAHQHDMFGSELRVGAGQDRQDFGTGEVLPFAVHGDAEPRGKVESLDGFTGRGLGSGPAAATWARPGTSVRNLRRESDARLYDYLSFRPSRRLAACRTAARRWRRCPDLRWK